MATKRTKNEDGAVDMQEVTATKIGYFDQIREPGDVFLIPADVDVSKSSWLKSTKATAAASDDLA